MRKRIYYTKSQKTLMWERWERGESVEQISQLFDPNHYGYWRCQARSSHLSAAFRHGFSAWKNARKSHETSPRDSRSAQSSPRLPDS